MFADDPDTIAPPRRTFAQKLQDDLDEQQTSTLRYYLRLGAKDLPKDRQVFKTLYGITDEQLTKEPDLMTIANDFSLISRHCRDFDDKKIFEKFLETIIKITNHFEESHDDFNQVSTIIKDWGDAMREGNDDASEKRKKEFEDWHKLENNFIEEVYGETKDVFEQVDEFKNETVNDWEFKVKDSVLKIEKKSKKSRKNYPNSLLKDIQQLGKAINEALITMENVTNDLKKIITYTERIKETLPKIIDDRGPISIKKIYLDDIKNKWQDLGKLASASHNRAFIMVQKKEKEEGH
ncbi:14367_t:CDS:2 [Acaulospora morrowiae]|uniref:14367_t:CDS:1 n=1 Tax=Acaulospora morrowiae TaxID=94023 RepID=A0A9N8V601_9GLOM|nr:14367_t:CDS:2 [Acaulospora morrowiae]